MQDLGNNQEVKDALNTLKANAPEQVGEQAAAQEFGEQAQAAEAQQADAQQTAAEGVAPEAQAFAQETTTEAAFNANGNPDEQNVTTEVNEADRQENVEVESTELDEVDLINELRDEISHLNGQIEILKGQVANEHDKMLRAVAEADNVRKRAAQDVDRAQKFALEKFVRSLLPIYDAMEKALEFSDRNNEATKGTLEGVENTMTLFIKELSSFGVELVDPVGKPFDPNFHQAVSQIPTPDAEPNSVLQTLQKGFTLNGRVVRAAMVIVAKAP